MKRKKKNKNLSKFLLFITLLIIGVLFFAAYLGINPLFAKNTDEKEIAIASGSGVIAIAKQLENEGIIKNAYVFRLYSKFLKSDTSFRYGKFKLSPKMNYDEIIDRLCKSSETSVTVTVFEGSEIRDIVKLFEEKGLINVNNFYDEIANGKFDYDFITSELPKGKARLEGYLFPDTYEINPLEGEHSIINKMLKRFSAIYNDEYKTRAKELNMTAHEVITLASVIEMESSKEREIVSSVFHNRLNSDYKYLESCATVLYAMQVRKDILSDVDTKFESPYNTYMHKGLPPGPIASPGDAAIKAALYPADTNYYFFLATGDGKNIFSQTYEEHLEKVRNR